MEATPNLPDNFMKLILIIIYFNSYTVKRMSRQRELTSNLYHPESAALLDQTDSKPKTGSFPAKQVQTVVSTIK